MTQSDDSTTTNVYLEPYELEPYVDAIDRILGPGWDEVCRRAMAHMIQARRFDDEAAIVEHYVREIKRAKIPDTTITAAARMLGVAARMR
jgi:hypothetical protein